jgi:hypothetical protein
MAGEMFQKCTYLIANAHAADGTRLLLSNVLKVFDKYLLLMLKCRVVSKIVL